MGWCFCTDSLSDIMWMNSWQLLWNCVRGKIYVLRYIALLKCRINRLSAQNRSWCTGMGWGQLSKNCGEWGGDGEQHGGDGEGMGHAGTDLAGWGWGRFPSPCRSLVCTSLLAPRSWQITTPVPHHSIFYRPDALPATQPTMSKHWRHFNA